MVKKRTLVKFLFLFVIIFFLLIDLVKTNRVHVWKSRLINRQPKRLNYIRLPTVVSESAQV